MARALVVDDDSRSRDVLRKLCRRMGLEAATAVDGADALSQLRRRGADVVLLDVMMPELDGFGVLEALRREPVTPRPAVLLVTAAADVGARIHGSDLGAVDFVEKPARVEDLERRVRRALAVVELERGLGDEQKTLDAMRLTDDITGAGSFMQLSGVLEAQFRAAELAGKPISCVLIADEGFARAVIERGRQTASRRLQEVAQAIEREVRPTDFLFRVDAAELVLLAPGTDAAGALALATAVRKRLVGSRLVPAAELAMGIASYPYHDTFPRPECCTAPPTWRWCAHGSIPGPGSSVTARARRNRGAGKAGWRI